MTAEEAAEVRAAAERRRKWLACGGESGPGNPYWVAADGSIDLILFEDDKRELADAAVAMLPADGGEPVTPRAAAEKLLCDIDRIARDYDHYEYGLPLHENSDETHERMVAVVLAALGVGAGGPG